MGSCSRILEGSLPEEDQCISSTPTLSLDDTHTFGIGLQETTDVKILSIELLLQAPQISLGEAPPPHRNIKIEGPITVIILITRSLTETLVVQLARLDVGHINRQFVVDFEHPCQLLQPGTADIV